MKRLIIVISILSLGVATLAQEKLKPVAKQRNFEFEDTQPSPDNTTDHQPSPLTQYRVARSGWAYLPFVDQAAEVRELAPRVIEGVTVQAKFHQLKEESLAYAESCNPKADEVALVSGRQFAVREFKTLAIKDRVFAYEVNYYYVTTSQGRILERAGAMFPGYYVDEDGNGTFEMPCSENRYRKDSAKTLPQWAKELAINP